MELQRGNAQAALATAQQEPTGEGQDVAPALARQISVTAVPPEGAQFWARVSDDKTIKR